MGATDETDKFGFHFKQAVLLSNVQLLPNPFLRLETCRIGTDVYFLCSYSIGLQNKQMTAAKMCKVGSYEIGHTSPGLINHSGVYKNMNAEQKD